MRSWLTEGDSVRFEERRYGRFIKGRVHALDTDGFVWVCWGARGAGPLVLIPGDWLIRLA
jgi:hypothetical protein